MLLIVSGSRLWLIPRLGNALTISTCNVRNNEELLLQTGRHKKEALYTRPPLKLFLLHSSVSSRRLFARGDLARPSQHAAGDIGNVESL